MNTAVRERPILFSAPMVRAILDGRKTVTRRIAKHLADDQVRDFIYARGKVWASMTPEELSPSNPNQSIFGGEVLHDGVQSYTPVVVGKGPKGEGNPLRCPYGVPGDRLWVKECWRLWSGRERDDPEIMEGRLSQCQLEHADEQGSLRVEHRATPFVSDEGPWRSPLFMYRWASRITLEVVDVRIERLQDITEDDAFLEGFDGGCVRCGESEYNCQCAGDGQPDYRESFIHLWETINGRDSWDANPWVWRVEFKRLETA